jgi:hypothetical protein
MDGARDEIGIGKEEFRVRILEEMRTRGFPALGAENLVFDKDKSGEARYLLGGTVRQVDCAEPARTRCTISILWELLDSSTDRITYQVLTRASADAGTTQGSALADRLVMGALRSLLDRPKFRAALSPADEHGPSAPPAQAQVRVCGDVQAAMPAAADQLLDAVVMVEAGQSLGTGTFISPDGFVLTAAHVLPRAASVKVKTRAEEILNADVVRIDRGADVALLRVSGHSVRRCVSLGAGHARVGEEVYVAGTPLSKALAYSLSRGIVSGIREVRGQELIQTDASVNAGNSGGPLFDTRGRLVAVVRSKLVGTGIEGVAFGVPALAALAHLGLTPASRTDASLLQGSIAEEPEAESVRDDPDPDPTAPVAKKAAPSDVANLSVQATRLPTPAEEAEARRRKKTIATAGVVIGAGGLVGAATTWGLFRLRKSDLTRNEHDHLQTLNDLSWGAAACGALVALLFTSWDSPAKAAAPNVSAAPRGLADRLNVAFTFGPSSFVTSVGVVTP